MSYTTEEKGASNSTDYRVYFRDGRGNAISPIHDIPLIADSSNKTYNMVVEVPRWSNAKMEISMKEVLNPIKQDVKNGKLRFVANCFPYHGYIWNYGALPQTWESSDHVDIYTECKGDNDPIDVLEIGYKIAKRGEVVQVKILGGLALIDEGETDWKLIAIDVNDPAAKQLNDIADVDELFPGMLEATVEWFKIYKIPDGKLENQFAFDGEAQSARFANSVIEEAHKYWKMMVGKEIDSGCISCSNVTLDDSPFKLRKEDAEEVVDKAPKGGESEPINDLVNKWHYIR